MCPSLTLTPGTRTNDLKLPVFAMSSESVALRGHRISEAQFIPDGSERILRNAEASFVK